MDKFEEKKQQIKNAAIKMFGAYGYKKTTLEDITGTLGMKKNSLYYYYESKEALFYDIITCEVEDHIKLQNAVFDKNISAEKKINEIVNNLISFIKERTTRYSIRVKSYIEIAKVIRDSNPKFSHTECDLLGKIINQGIKNGEFKKHNAEELAEDLKMLIESIIVANYSLSDSEFVNEIDYDTISATIVRMVKYIIDGIKIK